MTDSRGTVPLTKREHRQRERLAERLGQSLRPDGVHVRGHHGSVGDGKNGCGSYDLILNVDAERVDCEHCGATDLTTCSGGKGCKAKVHVHGCYADHGACDSPDEHYSGGYAPHREGLL